MSSIDFGTSRVNFPVDETDTDYSSFIALVNTEWTRQVLSSNSNLKTIFTRSKSGFAKNGYKKFFSLLLDSGLLQERICHRSTPFMEIYKNKDSFLKINYDTTSIRRPPRIGREFLEPDEKAENSRTEKKIYVEFISTNEDEYNTFNEIIDDELQIQKEESIYIITNRGGSLDLTELGQASLPLERENYTKEVLEGFDKIAKDLTAQEPSGRLSIIWGPTGSGKSYIVRGLLDKSEGPLYVILPARLITEVDGPSIVPLLLEYKQYSDKENNPIVFIIEDADNCLVPRSADNMSFISSLLNYSDGIFGKLLDLRIIATTNADSIEIDEALKRPGRLTEALEVDNLLPNKANSVYQRLTKTQDCPYSEKVSLAKIYSDSKNQTPKGFQGKKKKMGF